jgi:hypothetical protein
MDGGDLRGDYFTSGRLETWLLHHVTYFTLFIETEKYIDCRRKIKHCTGEKPF